MKRIAVLLMFLVMSLSGSVFAEQPVVPSPVDQVFQKANQWLHENNAVVTTDPHQAFIQDAIVVYGEGVAPQNITHPGQREAMAKRAAEVVAQRSLAEFIHGFAIVSDTRVENMALKYDVIRSAVAGMIKGAQTVVLEYNREKDLAVAIVKLGMRGPKGFGATMYEKILATPAIRDAVIQDSPVFTPPPSAPVPVEINYDGLIVDATEHSFRPALINRIFTTKGEVLYDPSKVSQKVLVEQGCGEYTNSVDKAKAALTSRGVNKPLLVKAAGTVSPSDLQVSDDDAVKIFSADQKGGFLAGAKVAFVLK